MSVVVRMEMPENCLQCPLHEFGGVCLLKVEHTAEEWLNIDKRRPLNCPIICSLPEGHGRLVSEKDVRWAIDDIVIEIAERIGHVPMTKNETMEYVNRLPTIVPAEAERSET